jgi:hypothetical protein
MLEHRYNANDRNKDFMINHNESELRRPGIEPGSPDSQSNALPIGQTGRLAYTAKQPFIFIPNTVFSRTTAQW